MNTNNIKYLALLSGTAMAISLAGCGGGSTDSNTTAQKLLATATAGGSWVNTGIATQTGVFTVSYDASVTSSPSDAEVGLSNGSQSAFTGFPVMVRFNTLGKIDARNAGAYAASNSISFSANVVYHFRLAVDATNHKYSVYVTAPGGSEQTVASNYAFRTEQATVSSINNWAAYMNASSGSETVNNFTIGTTTTTTTAATTTTSTAATTSTVATTTTTTSGSGACTTTVASSSAWSTAMSTVKAGDVVCVTSGANAASLKIAGKAGTAAKPITIRASTPLGTTLFSFEINASSYIVFRDFKIKSNASTMLKLSDSQHLSILRNEFDSITAGASGSIITSSTSVATESDDIEVGYNYFHDKVFPGNNGQTLQSGSFIKTSSNGAGAISKRMWIHHNYFKNMAPHISAGQTIPDGDSDRESIIFGDSGSQTVDTNHIVEYNLFEDCDGEGEMISLKTSTNIIRYNTMKNSMGGVSVRFGHNSEVYGNFFFGTGASATYTDPNYQTGGIRIYGTGHKIYNNYMQNLTGTSYYLPILLDSGDTDLGTNNGHQRPMNVTIVNNTLVNNVGGLTVGSTHYSMQPNTNIIANNIVTGSSGTLYDNYAITGNTFAGNIAFASGSATAGASNINGNPLLQSVTENTYSLQKLSASSSLAINAAQGSYAYVTKDMDGETRSTPDIGADEYSASSTQSIKPLTVSNVGPAAP